MPTPDTTYLAHHFAADIIGEHGAEQDGMKAMAARFAAEVAEAGWLVTPHEPQPTGRLFGTAQP